MRWPNDREAILIYNNTGTKMADKFIENGWQSYRKHVLPQAAPPIQIKETRRAFFGGAAILFETIMLALDSGEEPTDADMQRLTDLQAEIDEYGQQIDREAFGLTEH